MYELLYLIGQRPYMEDNYYINEFFCDGKYSLYAVFDGHGGNAVSLKCKDRLPYVLQSNLEKENDEISALRKTFTDIDDNLELSESFMTGSTCLVVLKKQDTLWIANCGDSRCIIQHDMSYHVLSNDHKPIGDEKKRIESIGGTIFHSAGTLRVNGDISLTRAIGDKRYRPFIIPDPEIVRYRLSAMNKFLILATDGLWDIVSNGHIIELFMKEYDQKNQSDKNVLKNSITKLQEKIGHVIADNTTVILIHLRR